MATVLISMRRFGATVAEARRAYRECIAGGMVEKEDDGGLLRMVRGNNAGKRDKNGSGLWVIGDVAFQRSVLEKDVQKRLAVARYQRDGHTLNQ